MQSILIAAVSMGVRFDKVLEQVARAGQPGRGAAVETRERKVRRLEDLIRAREVVGDRIVMCLGLALTLSAVALPVYAVYLSDGYAYLQSTGNGLLMSKGADARQARAPDLSPATTGSLNKQKIAESVAEAKADKATLAIDRQSQFQRYVIHRATSESALIEGPEGVWWVTPGMTLPGIGQIISIERSDNGWVVLTSETMISQRPTSKVAS
ncbi:hypothetical protein [Microvirga terrestris]|uniref:Uncharacterized protein n=1 Tax=Microvirga terrestris TaxID=2791024 RepID=A0ABS0HRG2_9HYPH|nr:hypothetical protein [Microvirga terrestris]MBF9195856.1 hypothetical protein [Microvirga terrestris]